MFLIGDYSSKKHRWSPDEFDSNSFGVWSSMPKLHPVVRLQN